MAVAGRISMIIHANQAYLIQGLNSWNIHMRYANPVRHRGRNTRSKALDMDVVLVWSGQEVLDQYLSLKFLAIAYELVEFVVIGFVKAAYLEGKIIVGNRIVQAQVIHSSLTPPNIIIAKHEREMVSRHQHLNPEIRARLTSVGTSGYWLHIRSRRCSDVQRCFDSPYPKGL